MTSADERTDNESFKFGGTQPDNIHVKTSVYGSDGTQVDVIPTNGFNGIVAIAPGHVSTDNSTSDTLLADATFTGEWEDITNFGVIVISVLSDKVSATNGLEVQFSSESSVGTIISDDVFTIEANAKKTFSFQAAAKFYRVVYTNGNVDQGSLILQAVLKPYYVKPSSHRITDSISSQDDAELVKSVITGQKPNNDFVNFQATSAGNFKTSLEEFDPSFLDTPLPVTAGFNLPIYDDVTLTYVASGNGEGQIETVVFKAATVTVATLTLSYNSDDKLTGVVHT